MAYSSLMAVNHYLPRLGDQGQEIKMFFVFETNANPATLDNVEFVAYRSAVDAMLTHDGDKYEVELSDEQPTEWRVRYSHLGGRAWGKWETFASSDDFTTVEEATAYLLDNQRWDERKFSITPASGWLEMQGEFINDLARDEDADQEFIAAERAKIAALTQELATMTAGNE